MKNELFNLAFVSDLSSKLDPSSIQNRVSSDNLPTTILSNLTNNILVGVIFGVAAVLSLIYGGFLYMTAGANPEQAETGKRVIIYTVIAMVVVIASYAIYETVTGL